MAKAIERLRYFDGEFLRSADLEQEQAYHIGMRRQLNLELHRYGIVRGLEIANDPAADKVDLKVFRVNAGLALDCFGRELIVRFPHEIDDEILSLNQVTSPGTYDLWLIYQEQAATPPSLGMQNCAAGAADQYTRWREGFRLVIVSQDAPISSKPEDKPKAGMGGVPLGSIVVSSVDGRLRVSGEVSEKRTDFVGSRTQRVELPEESAKSATFDVFAGDPPSPRRWFTIEPNATAEKNFGVGDNFAIDFGSKPKPAKKDTGNLKVAGDLFLQGSFFQRDGASWSSLDDYIAARVQALAPALMPDVQIGSGVVLPAENWPTSGAIGSTLIQIAFSSPVETADPVGGMKAVVSLTGFKFRDKTGHNNWFNNIPANVKMEIRLDTPQVTRVSPNNYFLETNFLVGPTTNNSPGTEKVQLVSCSYSYVVVLRPKVN
ncbi:MAG: hypothetical protein ACK6DX_13790 [Acidobacteriota bacterium]